MGMNILVLGEKCNLTPFKNEAGEGCGMGGKKLWSGRIKTRPHSHTAAPTK